MPDKELTPLTGWWAAAHYINATYSLVGQSLSPTGANAAGAASRVPTEAIALTLHTF